MFSPLEQFDVILFMKGNFPFVHIIVPLIIILLLIKIAPLNEFTLVPTLIQRCFEVSIESISDLIDQQIGEDGYIYSPLLFVLFILYYL
jgi:F0F1-type ATP synthase membrane subunit a